MTLEFSGVLGLWTAGLVAALLGVIAWKIYRRRSDSMSAHLAWILPILRIAVIAATVFISTGPQLQGRQSVEERGRVLVLVDGSRSMELTDAPPGQGKSRWKRTEAMLLENPHRLLSKLSERHDVELRILSGREAVSAWRSGGDAMPKGLPALPGNPMTDLGNGLLGGVGREEEPWQAAILFSDGQHNEGKSPLEIAPVLAARPLPVHTVVLGSAAPVEDLAVLEVDAPESVDFKDRVKGRVLLKDRVTPGQGIAVEIECEGQGVFKKLLTTEDSGQRGVPFDIAVEALAKRHLERKGKTLEIRAIPLKFKVKVSVLPGEKDVRNNEREFYVRVIRDHRRVLILDGGPRWEVRYLRNLFERDSRWEEVNALVTQGGGTSQAWPRGAGAGRFPSDRASLFAYDLIIFGEVFPQALTKEELEGIRDFVDKRGGGLVFLDGRQGALKEQAAGPLGPLVPVKWDDRSEPIARLALGDAGRPVSYLNLSPESGDNDALWSALPPPRWAAPASLLPGAEAWVEAVAPSGARRPAIVHRKFGAGHVLYSGIDEFWRWRQGVGDLHYQRFWNQVTRALMPEPFAAQGPYADLHVERVGYKVGDAVEIRARLKDATGRPLENGRAEILLFRDGKPLPSAALASDPAGGGLYRARLEGLGAGAYEVGVRINGVADADIPARTEFWVRESLSLELSELQANPGLLRQLSARTKGKFFDEGAVDGLPDVLESLVRHKSQEETYVVWQTWWWFVPMIAFLTVEWVIRKWAGMI